MGNGTALGAFLVLALVVLSAYAGYTGEPAVDRIEPLLIAIIIAVRDS